mgnify:CR=1 FL=1
MDLSITMASGILSNFEPKTEFNRVFSFHFTRWLTNFKIHKMIFGVITIVRDKTTTVDSAFFRFKPKHFKVWKYLDDKNLRFGHLEGKGLCLKI